MKKVLPTILLFVLAASIQAAESRTGAFAVYAAGSEGRPTASGELYDPSLLTAAHDSLPMGTMVRVATLSTGRMVDVRINDRKPSDSVLLYLSHGAASRLAIPGDRLSQGTMMVVPAAGAATAPPLGNAAVPTSGAGNTSAKPFEPFRALGEWKEREAMKKAVRNPGLAASTDASMKQAGGNPFAGLFGKNRGVAPPPSAPAVGYPTAATIPMSAQGGMVPPPSNYEIPAPEAPVPNTYAPRSVAPITPVGANNGQPYRVQFGAFRDMANAQQLSGQLNRDGLGTVVSPDPNNGLLRVVTNAGFASPAQANGWIDYEAARRGWSIRPVVTQ